MAEARPPDGPLSRLGIGVIAAVIIVDQAAKAVAKSTLALAEPIDLLPILSLYRVHNQGIAFSLLAGFAGIGLVLLTLAITAIVLSLWWRATEGGRLAAVGYALILGGAVGNLIDRIAYGHVVDFLLLHFGDWTLFVFNLADVALTFGPILLLIVYLLPKRA